MGHWGFFKDKNQRATESKSKTKSKPKTKYLLRLKVTRVTKKVMVLTNFFVKHLSCGSQTNKHIHQHLQSTIKNGEKLMSRLKSLNFKHFIWIVIPTLFLTFLAVLTTKAFLPPEFHPVFTELTAFGIRWEIIMFAAMLISVAIFYKRTTDVAIIGTTLIIIYKLIFVDDFFLSTLSNSEFCTQYLELINLAGMLMGFNILADNFERSGLTERIPKFLPHNYLSGFILLLFIFIISTFLDNIAAAMIGFSIAYAVFRKKLHIGYIVAIVAASNAGGSGSVVGDTTTTLMWIAGQDPLSLTRAFVPAIIAFLIFGLISARQQYKWSPMDDFAHSVHPPVVKRRIFLCVTILMLCIAANYIFKFPALGIWIAIFVGKYYTDIDWKLSPETVSSTVFLLVMVFSANLIPLNGLPEPSTMSTFLMGLISAVFNNIPLTQLCLSQGNYDWALLSFAVGFGGSLVWFGSSAGVAVCDKEPKARSIVSWMRYGWPVALAYCAAFGIYIIGERLLWY